MNARTIFGAVLLAFCLAELWMFHGQRQQLAELRAAQQRLMASRSSDAEIPAEPAHSAPNTGASPELLRLRGQVTRLEERRRELASVPAQNTSLRTQLASRGTNAVSGVRLPPGYIRASEARFVGYGSPADTIQSLLWAIRNHDAAHLLQAFPPEAAEHIPATNLLNEAFQEIGDLPGIAIVETRQMPDGSIEAKMEIDPDTPAQRVKFQQINGEWKLAGPF